jgi:hypothetical protein
MNEALDNRSNDRVDELIKKARQVFIGNALYMKQPVIVRAYDIHLECNISLDEAAMLAIPALLEQIANLEKLVGLTPPAPFSLESKELHG